MTLQVYSLDWCAGLIEAEGSFGPSRSNGGAFFSLTMNDRDTVTHLVDLIGRSVFPSIRKVWTNYRKGTSKHIATRAEVFARWRIEAIAMQVGQMLRQKRDAIESCLHTTLPPTYYKPNLDWFVGFIDGEGTFSYNSAVIGLENTDLGALELLQEYFNAGSIRPKKPIPNRKPQWVWTVCGDNARDIMRTIHPMMCLRRQFQIEESLSSSKKLPISARPAYKYLVTNREGGDRIWTPTNVAA